MTMYSEKKAYGIQNEVTSGECKRCM